MISEEDAEACVAILTSSTTYGWDDETTNEYVGYFMTLQDPRVLATVCAQVMSNWQHAHKPPKGVITQAYDFECRRRDMDRPALPSGPSDGVHPDRGWGVAGEAYAAAFGRAMHETPVADGPEAERLIVEVGRWHEGRHAAHYIDVLQGMHGDHRKTQLSLKALGPRLHWATNSGTLSLSLRPVSDGNTGGTT